MVTVEPTDEFKKAFVKLKHSESQKQILSHIAKLELNPELGKPMRYSRKGSRELYVGSFRLAYVFANDTIFLLDIYHKDEQ